MKIKLMEFTRFFSGASVELMKRDQSFVVVSGGDSFNFTDYNRAQKAYKALRSIAQRQHNNKVKSQGVLLYS